jgi:hypothetical protein
MREYGKRDDLKRKLIQAFSVQEEIYRIYLFEGEPESARDAYADIVLIVCSNDPATTQASYLHVLEALSPVRAMLAVHSTPDVYTAIVMLRDYSPYYRIDLTITSALRGRAWLYKQVYESNTKSRVNRSHLQRIQIKQDVVHLVSGVLFSATRFVQSLSQGDMEMYRHWKNVADLAVALLYERHFGWQAETSGQELTAEKTRALYARLNSGERWRIQRMFPPDGNLNLIASYRTGLSLFIQLAQQKAADLGVALNYALISYIQRFLDAELERFQMEYAAA